MLCERCQKNQATYHLCTIIDGVSHSSELCADCYEATSPQFRAISTAQKDSHCEYCGAQPCAIGPDIFAMATGVQKLKAMCMPCSVEYNRYTQESFQHSEELSQDDQLEFIRKLARDAHAHMKFWVSQRSSR